MAGITLEQAETQLNLYLDAEAKVLAGQRVRIGDKDITKADLEMIQRGVSTWDARVKQLSASAASGGCRVMRRVVPIV